MGQEPVQDARWRYDGGLHQRVDPDPHQPPPPGVPLGGPGPPSHPPPFLVGGPSRSDGLMKKSASADSLPVFCAAPVDEVSSAPELQSLNFNLSCNMVDDIMWLSSHGSSCQAWGFDLLHLL